MSDPAYALGMISGVVAISVAVYLEWVNVRPCNAKWVYAYLVLGVGLVLVSAGGVVEAELQLLRAAGFGLILVLEIVGFVHIKSEIDSSGIAETISYGERFG